MFAAMALVLAMVAACGGDDDDSATTGTSSSTTAAAAPTDSGSASMTMAQPEATAEAAMPDASGSGDAMMGPKVDRVVVGAQQPSLISNNVAKGLSPQSQIQLVAMYEYMIGTDAQTGALIPQLATEWSVEPNGQDFRIKLREGVRFHGDNGTLTYRDVERTLAELSSEESEHTHARDYRKATIEPVSDLEFIWKLTTPVAEQVRRFSEQVGGLEIMSATDYDKT
ncbi:MAG: ABC transporter substrate-binding protein, partial [Chloroflexota bacterium]|nr:ABC transporter substrate-binding protein [Chloroflexota bacterium]